MFGNATTKPIVAAMNKTRDSEGVRMATWNPRLMVSPHTEQGAAKRRRVQRAIRAGIIVALQETHWAVSKIVVWSGLFPGAVVVATGARPGPNGGPQGGVALVIPIRYEILNSRTVITGLCAEATVAKRGGPDRTEWVVQSLYLPPDDRKAATEAYVSDSRDRNGALYVGGDMHMQMHRPRTDNEQDDATVLCGEWQRRGSAPVNQGKDTKE